MTTASRLTNLHTWLPELAAIEQGRGRPRSPRPNPTHTTTTTGVPFGVRGRPDPDHPADAHTTAEITAWATYWAGVIATERSETPPRRHPLLYLATVADWAAHHLGDDLADETQAIHSRAARLTGHTDQDDPDHRCPHCGGTLTQAPTPQGLTDQRLCRTCDTAWPDPTTIETYRAARLTGHDATPLWVTKELAAALHPRLRDDRGKDVLRQWVHRRRVAQDERGRVNLTDINRLLRTTPGEC